MSDTVSTETKLQDSVLKLIIEYKESVPHRYRSDAIRDLIGAGIDRKSADQNIPPKYIDKFDNEEGRVGFSVTKAASFFVKKYANQHSIEYQKAFFEFICCGLEAKNTEDPI